MKTVWKFPFKIKGSQVVRMPANAEVLLTGLDPTGAPCIWAKVQPDVDTVDYTVCITGTGHPIPEGDNIRHLGSFVQHTFVWHVWMSK